VNKFIKQKILLVSVFITGACVLIIEVVAVRALSPHYGNTIFTVSSVISVILTALSIGYYVGGKFADKHPSMRWFFGIILASGLMVMTIQFLSIIILPILSFSLSFTSGPLVSSMLLFFLPAFLLGTLSPFAIKLQSMEVPDQGIGSISGKIFFWSTLGSILGSLFAGFILIPHFGIDYIFITTGAVLFILGFFSLVAVGFRRGGLTKYTIIFLGLIGISFFATEQMNAGALYSKDGIYEKIVIYDSTYGGRPIRAFQQDHTSSGAMFLDTDDPVDLVYDYTKYYSLYKVFNPDIERVLVIGGGAYSVPKALLAELPNAKIDVSEIEPSLYDLAKKYFNVQDNPNLHIYTQDGRRFLRDTDKKYDMIFSDVYYSLYSIPAHFIAQEFFILAKEKLSADGIFVANVIGDLSRQEPSLIFAEIKTFQSVFPNSYFFAVQSADSLSSQNIMFVGYNGNKNIDFSSLAILQNKDSILSSLHRKVINLDRYDLSQYPILTDNFAPVEYLTAQVLDRTFKQKKLFDGQEMLALIDQQLRYGPRYMGSIGREKTERFLIAEMHAHTDKVLEQSWDYMGSDGNTYGLKNIIARLSPLQDRRIILATHYDSKRFADLDSVHKDAPMPGANDSASGTAVLVELARMLAKSSAMLNIGVDIVFFDGEEGDINQGVDYSAWKPLGSTYFAEHLNELYGAKKPELAIVLDMVCDKDLKIYKEAMSVQSASTQVDLFWDIARKVDPNVFQNEIGVGIIDDHTPLNNAQVPSFLVIDFEYPYFHTTHDTLDKCSAKSLETVARALYEYVVSI
jgi:glutaminyl-peptide cyclotransferase